MTRKAQWLKQAMVLVLVGVMVSGMSVPWAAAALKSESALTTLLTEEEMQGLKGRFGGGGGTTARGNVYGDVVLQDYVYVNYYANLTASGPSYYYTSCVIPGGIQCYYDFCGGSFCITTGWYGVTGSATSGGGSPWWYATDYPAYVDVSENQSASLSVYMTQQPISAGS
ncbi:MAG: hypothetical protein HZA23_03925 [Nitrospirae bacterium]|nr:hypothetical protein [Nitrospirota bacterium]